MTSSLHRPTPRPSPFPSLRPPPKRGWLERLLRVPRPDLAEQALQSLLVRRQPSEVASTEISALLLRYGVVGPPARELLVSIWQRVLAAFLADDALSEPEIRYLEALRRTLTLTPAEVEQAERTVIHPRYEVAVGEAIADRHLSDAERSALDRLAEQLRLPPEVERDIYERSARRALAALVRESVADRRLSPEERDELALLAGHLGVEVSLDEATEAMLDRYALFWRVENGDCPTVTAPITLEAGEHCLFCCPAAWHRPLSHAKGGELREGVVSVRVARGVYYRCGSASDDFLTSAHHGRLREMDRGRLYITSRQVIFEGERGPIRRGLRSIDAFQVYRDGLILEKTSGRGLYLTLDGDVELAAVVLGAAMARA
jgi:hypothetical protein